MRNFYLIAFGTILLAITSIVSKPVYATLTSSADSVKKAIYLKDNRPNRPKFETVINNSFESFMLKVSAIKPSATKNQSTSNNKNNIAIETNKSIDNVKVYPNPVSTHLNLTFSLSKESLVTVKIVDILGNEVITLLSQKLASGEQSNSFNISSKLNSGLYFVRIVAGSESVIKRISVL